MQVAGIFAWWLLIAIAGIITFPIAFKTFPNLSDKGYSFSKPLGLLLIGLLSWLIGYISFSTVVIILSALIIAGVSTWIFLKSKEEIVNWVKDHVGYILVVELFFLILYLFFIYFRMHNADIVGTEKFMDLAFLNAISRSPSMPPYDPWLSGQGFYISYYYFGYLLMALFVKVSGVAPAIGFNLSLSMLYALSGLSVFGLIYNIVKRITYAAGGWAFIYLIGNLDGFRQVMQTKTIENFNWWTPSRVIPDTINEFPFFSYLLGDMHPHMLAVPFIMIALAMALNHLKSNLRTFVFNDWGMLTRFGLWGLVIGSFGFINSWDLPSMFFMAMLTFFFQQYRQRESFKEMPWKGIAGGLGIILLFVIVPFLPFYMDFHSQAKGINLTTQNTRIADFFLIFGPMMFVVLSFIVVRYHAWFLAIVNPPAVKSTGGQTRKIAYCSSCGAKLRDGKLICGQCGHQAEPKAAEEKENNQSPFIRPFKELPDFARQLFMFLLQPVIFVKQQKKRAALWTVLGSLVFIIFMMVVKAMTYGHTEGNPAPLMMGFMLFLLLAIFILLVTKIEKTETVFVYCMLGTAFLLLFGCEFLHINDTFNPPLDRMNTVFKFYYMSWFLIGTSAVYGFYWMFSYSLKNKNIRAGWLIPLVLLIMASLIYPYAGTMVKTNHFNNKPTLDGSDYLNNVYSADREGIEWLRHHVNGNPVILEATGGEYTDFARVSTFTGLPTVLGWGGHELQWRGNYDEPGKRIPAIEDIYSTADINKAGRLLDQYNVEYVFVGTLEKQKYATHSLEKFGRFMQLVYKNDGVKIYRKK